MTRALFVLAALGTAASLLYYLAACVAAMRFARLASSPAPPLPEPAPGIAVLKPLVGLSPTLIDNLTSYLEDGYPRAQFLFAVAANSDRAAEVPAALRASHPGADITLIVGDEPGVANRKIAKVIRMAERAEDAEAFVLSDADIAVERGHLSRVIGELFADERIGLVTCLYRSRPSGSFASRLGALFVNTDFAPMVMLSAAIEPIRYALGATIAVRRAALEAAGGTRPLGDKLADDYELGRTVADRGWAVRLSNSIVTSASEERGFGDFWRHKLRWARTYRIVRPESLLTILINGPLWASLLLWVTGASAFGLAAFATVLAVRMGMAGVIVARVLKLPELVRDVWMVPMKDLIMAAIWAASLAGNTVEWGGRRFTVAHDGVMHEVANG